MEPTATETSPTSPRPVIRRGTVRVAAGAGVAALLLAAIPALAADTSATVTYYGCVTNKTGALRIVSKSTACGSGQHKISWNNTGPRGPQGSSGVTNAYVDSAPSQVFGIGGSIIASVKLPAGNWIVSASVDLTFNNSGGASADTASCSLADGQDNLIDESDSTWTTDPDFSDGSTTIAITGETSNAGTATLECMDLDGITPSPIASNAIITATQVNHLHVSFHS